MLPLGVSYQLLRWTGVELRGTKRVGEREDQEKREPRERESSPAVRSDGVQLQAELIAVASVRELTMLTELRAKREERELA